MKLSALLHRAACLLYAMYAHSPLLAGVAWDAPPDAAAGGSGLSSSVSRTTG